MMVTQLPLGIGLPDSAVFATFHVGANAVTCAALKAASRGDGEPVSFLHGPTGAGKSHLLQASCALAGTQGRRAALLPLAQAAVLTPSMIEGWEQFDLVCVDDIGAVAGRADWESALFGLFNALRAAGGCWIAAGLDAPAGLAFTLPDLSSRLAAGPVYRLQELDDPGRMDALRVRAGQRGLELPAEVAQLLLRHLPRDMNTLVEALATLDRASLTEQRRLTVPFVKRVLGL